MRIVSALIEPTASAEARASPIETIFLNVSIDPPFGLAGRHCAGLGILCTRVHNASCLSVQMEAVKRKYERKDGYRQVTANNVYVCTTMTCNNKLRLGVIGTGHMAARYARSWVTMPEVAFVAVSDVNAASRRKFTDICRNAGRPEPREFDDFKSMIAACRDELDAIYVSTPHALHAEHGIAVVEAGLDLLMEKPMVTTVEEAQRLISARDKSRSNIVIDFQGAL